MHCPQRPSPRPSRIASAALVAAAAFVAVPAAACTLTPNVVTDIGPYSPAAVKAAAVPALQSGGGLSCPGSVIVLLGGNYIRATFTSANGLLLKQEGGAATIAYAASADAGNTVPFAQGTTVDYMQNNLLNLLGLLGGSSAALPIFVKPSSATLPPVGTYSDTITIRWRWNLCPGVYVAGACIGGTLDADTGTTTIKVTLTVSPQNAVLAITPAATWDPVNLTNRPKALPGSRGRATVAVGNPDLVPLDNGSLTLVYPVSPRTSVAFDGDGATGTAAIGFAEGSPASSVTLAYRGPADTTDDVDFSNDGGTSWTYIPAPASPASVTAITHLRFRPKGIMAKQSAFAVSVAYLVK